MIGVMQKPIIAPFRSPLYTELRSRIAIRSRMIIQFRITIRGRIAIWSRIAIGSRITVRSRITIRSQLQRIIIRNIWISIFFNILLAYIFTEIHHQPAYRKTKSFSSPTEISLVHHGKHSYYYRDVIVVYIPCRSCFLNLKPT